MPEPGQESGTPEKSVDWAQALSETLSKSTEKETPPETKAAKEPDPSDVASTETPVEKTEPTEVAEVGESQDALKPHERWSEDVKSYFSKLDKQGQQFLLDREKDVESHLTKRTQEVSEIQKRYQKLDDVLKPFDDFAKKNGVDLAPHMAQAMNAYFAFQRDPVSTVKALIQAQKLTPEMLGLVDDGTDPNIKALRDQLDETRRELAGLRQGTVQATESQFVSHINSFKEAKNEDGSPKHPHFESVREVMAPLVAKFEGSMSPAEALSKAYEQAVWALPEYRDNQIKASQANAEKEAKKKAEVARLEKLKKAKSAETLAPSDADKGSGKAPMKSWEDALNGTLNKLRS